MTDTIVEQWTEDYDTTWKWTGVEFICGNLNGFRQPVYHIGTNNSETCISMRVALDDPDLGPKALAFFRTRASERKSNQG